MSPRDGLAYANEIPGLYAVRLAKGAVEVACEVTHGPAIDPLTGETLDRSWMWTICINGEVKHCSPAVYSRMLLGRPISRADYEFMLADRQWAREFAPGLPEAQPTKRVDISTLPMPF